MRFRRRSDQHVLRRAAQRVAPDAAPDVATDAAFLCLARQIIRISGQQTDEMIKQSFRLEKICEIRLWTGLLYQRPSFLLGEGLRCKLRNLKYSLAEHLIAAPYIKRRIDHRELASWRTSHAT